MNTLQTLVQFDQALNPETYLSTIRKKKSEFTDRAIQLAEALNMKKEFMKMKYDEYLDAAIDKATELNLREEFMTARDEAQKVK